MSDNYNWVDSVCGILDAVEESLETGDFSHTSDKIRRSVNGTRNYSPNPSHGTAGTAFENGMKSFGKAMNSAVDSFNSHQRQSQLIAASVPGRILAPLEMAIGGIMAFNFGIFTLAFLIEWTLSDLPFFLVLLALTLFFGWVAVRGGKRNARNNHFKRYVNYMGNKTYVSIDELASCVGKSKSFVVKELQQMISDGYFPQGHIDKEETTLIISDDVYQEYLKTEKQRAEQKRKEETEAAVKAGENANYSKEVQDILEEGQAYIKHIHECNDAIPGADMSAKLAELESIMQRIFDRVKTDPDSADDLRKFMNYYLPTTTKLINTYRELDSQDSHGSANIEKTKREIEDTMDTINAAFAKILDDMYEEKSWDVSSEIHTMKNMMAQDGLTSDSGAFAQKTN